jgi:hypothetical protein
MSLTVQVGTPDFPSSAVANPSDFAARVREKLGDDKRLVRLYGTSTAIVRLVGDGTRTRVYLLSYSRNRIQQDVRVRVLGRWRPVAFAAFGAPPGMVLTDVETPGEATEFSLASFNTIAIVDLEKAR